MPSSDPVPWLNPTAAYLHIPFCAHHCGYCDFAVVSGRDHQIDLYVEALGAELATLPRPAPVKTIFFGGGTPTYLSVDQLRRLLTFVREWLPLEADGEFSIESTPESITSEKIDLLAEHGVTRISIGVQTFHEHLLPVLERIHGPEHVAPAVAAARQGGLSVSLDLIFGVPGQTLHHWNCDLHAALSLEPDHLSTYGLTYEKGTPLWKDRERGEIRQVEEMLELDMYLRAIDKLEEAGFEHYEISNFAKPGKRCRHNEVYWANHAYFGFGLGAARYVGGKREVNTRNLGEYLRRALAGEPATFQSEELGPEERARETAVVQLRRGDGINRQEFHQQTGFNLVELYGDKLIHWIENDIVQDDGERVRLTRKGKCLADSLAVAML